MRRARSTPWSMAALVGAFVVAGCLPMGGPHSPKPLPSLQGDPWATAFLDRPASGPIRKVGDCEDILIENLSFQDLGPDTEAIHLEKCNNVMIRANDFARVAQAITVIDSTNVRIEWNRYEDILGPHQRDGSHRANFVQLVEVTGGWIRNNKGRGGDTEDIVSMFRTGGTEDAPFYVERNHFEGTDWTSGSGSGIALGDGESSYAIARDNVLLNVGQVGVFIAGGTGHKILGNTVYGERRPKSNVGIYVWDRTEVPCEGHEVRDNRVHWVREDGERNGRWNGENCGTIDGWDDNDWDATLDPEALRVSL